MGLPVGLQYYKPSPTTCTSEDHAGAIEDFADHSTAASRRRLRCWGERHRRRAYGDRRSSPPRRRTSGRHHKSVTLRAVYWTRC